ncbi:MAG: cyclic pyranopterin monophosphate synthase MoaC [Acidobacteriota bacterium]|nr:cyclic pyranopterin monophosphate synthase MoaC [Blastocatellia bacterium]MDW8411436.1 cyclic pyranopterin monophosphate synthase MoaC [Acidobacteriota bacterium]
MSEFSHFGSEGQVQMVDVSAKAVTARSATASARVIMPESIVTKIRNNILPKGNPFEIARIAGILAAKQTAALIPLCHPLPLSHIDITVSLEDYGAKIVSSVKTTAQTGVEMEALTAATVAALTVYDMCKAIDKSIIITDIQLETKSGGKSGDWQRH